MFPRIQPDFSAPKCTDRRSVPVPGTASHNHVLGLKNPNTCTTTDVPASEDGRASVCPSRAQQCRATCRVWKILTPATSTDVSASEDGCAPVPFSGPETHTRTFLRDHSTRCKTGLILKLGFWSFSGCWRLEVGISVSSQSLPSQLFSICRQYVKMVNPMRPIIRVRPDDLL